MGNDPRIDFGGGQEPFLRPDDPRADRSAWLDPVRNVFSESNSRLRRGSRDALSGEPSAVDCVRRSLDPSRRVWILGQPGTGRLQLAERVHLTSPRRTEPFRAFDCKRCSPLVARRLFLGQHRRRPGITEVGDESGSSVVRHLGLLESIGSGTIYLEDIENLGSDLQRILADVFMTGCYLPIGSSQPRDFDGGIIVSTSSDLDRLVEAGRLVPDLRDQLHEYRLATAVS